MKGIVSCIQCSTRASSTVYSISFRRLAPSSDLNKISSIHATGQTIVFIVFLSAGTPCKIDHHLQWVSMAVTRLRP
ncbi:hypothetical protein Y032_0018g3625 [Ancylostoma ceylanicum]|nr:hypothetical protein Y032_0018g3625 [Ancylostoma ceylanicum]